MTAKLHGITASTAFQRAAVIFREKNVPFDLAPVDFINREHKSDTFRALHPFGQVPVLVEEDGFTLFESRAIAKYIANKYKNQGTRLIPDDEKEKALLDQWIFVETTDFDPYAAGLGFECVFKKMLGYGDPDETRIKTLRTSLDTTLDVYDKILGTRPYLTGNDISLADLFHLPWGQTLFVAGHGDAITSRKNVKAWWERVGGRESWKKTLEAGQKKSQQKL